MRQISTPIGLCTRSPSKVLLHADLRAPVSRFPLPTRSSCHSSTEINPGAVVPATLMRSQPKAACAGTWTGPGSGGGILPVSSGPSFDLSAVIGLRIAPMVPITVCGTCVEEAIPAEMEFNQRRSGPTFGNTSSFTIFRCGIPASMKASPILRNPARS